MSSGPVVLAGRSRLLLSLRKCSCCASSIDLLLARQPLIRKASARAGSMSDAHPPSCPPMTAIVVTKKNLPSFSEKRAAPLPPLTVLDEPGRRESNPVPSSTAVESALRSALGIGHSEACGASPTTPTALPQPELDANVSTQDPAILDWSLCNPDSEDTVAEPGSQTEDYSYTALVSRTTEADIGLNAVATTETNVALEPPLTSAGTQEVGDEHNVAGASAASTPSKRRCRRPRKRQKRSGKSAIASQQRSVSDDGSSSDESCAVVGDERDGEGLVADGWISELPAGLISSADTEDDDNDPVYSLKPLFTGKYGSSSSAKKSKPSKDNPAKLLRGNPSG
ncbi:hypothetical protein MTO96_008805 [Rhipicephalus appendiculatus]